MPQKEVAAEGGGGGAVQPFNACYLRIRNAPRTIIILMSYKKCFYNSC